MSLDSWFARQRPESLLAVRLLLLANGILLIVVGCLYALFASRPAGLIVGGVLLACAAALLRLLPYTNPARRH